MLIKNGNDNKQRVENYDQNEGQHEHTHEPDEDKILIIHLCKCHTKIQYHHQKCPNQSHNNLFVYISSDVLLFTCFAFCMFGSFMYLFVIYFICLFCIYFYDEFCLIQMHSNDLHMMGVHHGNESMLVVN